MGKPKRAVLAAAQESMTPPDELTHTQFVARVVKAEGNSLYTCELPNGKPIIAELEPRFRNTIFIRRGGYVLVDLESAEERLKTSRVMGEIINIVRDEKEWRKQPYWYALCLTSGWVLADRIVQAEEVRQEHVRRRRGLGLERRQDAAQRLGGGLIWSGPVISVTHT
jgi:probable RNA-binding protein EIF1AD